MKDGLVDGFWWVLARLPLIRWAVARASPRAAIAIGWQMVLRNTRSLIRRNYLPAAAKFYQLAIEHGDKRTSLDARRDLGGALTWGTEAEQQQAEVLLQGVADEKDPEYSPLALLSLGRLERERGKLEAAVAVLLRAAQWPDSYGNELAQDEIRSIRQQQGRSAAAQAREADMGPPLTVTFLDRDTGDRVAADPRLAAALLAKHGRPDLIGSRYFGRPTQEGYEITFGIR